MTEENKSKKKYKSTGAMLKAGDFEALIEDLIEREENDELKELTKKTTQNPISELDDLLFFFPQYATKKIKDENDNLLPSCELHPKALEALELMLKCGANPNAYMKNGENTYLKSCEIKNVEILNYLINNPYNKVDLTHTDGMGNTGLFYATMAESTEAIEYLVNTCSFDINEKNFLSHDQTVLHYACGHAKEKSLDKLIELGANPTIKDIYGCVPCDMIIAAYDEETIEEYDLNDPEDVAELKKWKELFDKVVSITKEYEATHKTKHKTKF